MRHLGGTHRGNQLWGVVGPYPKGFFTTQEPNQSVMGITRGFATNGKPIKPTCGTITVHNRSLVSRNPLRALTICNNMVGGNLVAEGGGPRFPLPILVMLAAVRSTLRLSNTTSCAIAVLGMMGHEMS